MPGIRQALEKLRGVRHIEWVFLVLALAALALLLTDAPAEYSGESTSLERRLEAVLSCVQGAGDVRVMVHSAEAVSAFAAQAGSASGVIVVAEGAGDLRVAMELQQAVQALLGVEAEHIEILSMKEDDS